VHFFFLKLYLRYMTCQGLKVFGHCRVTSSISISFRATQLAAFGRNCSTQGSAAYNEGFPIMLDAVIISYAGSRSGRMMPFTYYRSPLLLVSPRKLQTHAPAHVLVSLDYQPCIVFLLNEVAKGWIPVANNTA
jgi:hypothetical protein